MIVFVVGVLSSSSPFLLAGRGGSSVGGLGLLLAVLELGQDLPLVAAGVVVVGVELGLLLAALLARVTGEHGLLLVKVVVLVLVEVGLGHDGGEVDLIC